MATAVAPRQLKKRPIPDDAVIYREYVHQVMSKGEYGACSRTARVCGCSRVHIKNVVERHGLKKPAPVELAYEPAPGQQELENDLLLCQLLTVSDVTEAPDVMSILSSIEAETTIEPVTIERSYLDIPYTINLKHGPDRTRANQLYEVRLLALVTLILTIVDIVVSRKAFGLSVLLLPEILALWWVVLQLRRLVYWQ